MAPPRPVISKPWDVSYWAEKLRQESFELDSEALRPYFPLPRVLEGLFASRSRLFGITIEAADGEAPVWHSDVRFFRVLDDRQRSGPRRLLSRSLLAAPADKRGGAWMDECLVAHRRAPTAHRCCRWPTWSATRRPPVGETPSLMTFEEVETLFHEFGHGLQHMLTTVERPQAAGINGRGVGCGGAAEPVHGELVLRPRRR